MKKRTEETNRGKSNDVLSNGKAWYKVNTLKKIILTTRKVKIDHI